MPPPPLQRSTGVRGRGGGGGGVGDSGYTEISGGGVHDLQFFDDAVGLRRLQAVQNERVFLPPALQQVLGNVVLIPDGGKNRCTGQFPSYLGENERTVVLSRPWSTRCPRERQRLVNIHVVQGQTEGRIVGDIPTCGAAVLGFGWFGWADCHHDFLPRPFRPT